MAEHLGGIQGDYGFESRAFHQYFPPRFFAAQNVPITMLGKQEGVGSNPTADGLHLRIAQSGRAPK